MPSPSYRPDPNSLEKKAKACKRWVCMWFHQTPRITKLAQVGTAIWFALGFLGPLLMPVFIPIGDTPWYWAETAALLAFALFLVPFGLTIAGPTTAETWGLRQRIMLWQAAAGGAFLAIDWSDTKGDNKDDILQTVGLIAGMWVLGGAMGMWLEPAKSQGKRASTD